MRFIFGYCSETGIKKDGSRRNKNQDCMYFSFGRVGGQEVCLAAVCDGVGSFADSEYASRFVVESLRVWFNNHRYGEPESAESKKPRAASVVYEEMKTSLKEELWLAHERVSEETKSKNFNAATTACVLLVVHNLYCLYSTGDSRAYEVDGKMKQLTQDQVMTHPDGRVTLSNCLGCFPGPNFARIEGKVRKKSTYWLLSDGLYRRLDEKEVVKAYGKAKTTRDMFGAIHKLRDGVRANGEKDDSTGVALKFL